MAHEQIEYIKEKAWLRINIMLKFKFFLDRKSLETIYNYFIKPILEYRDVVWDNCTKQEKHDIEKIQIEVLFLLNCESPKYIAKLFSLSIYCYHFMFEILNAMYVVQYVYVLGDELNKL